jgi:hypothetical protein
VPLTNIGDTQARPSHIVGTWNEQGTTHDSGVLENNMLKVRSSLGKQHA